MAAIRVLVVDDDPSILLLVRSFLARSGDRYALETRDAFDSGLEALTTGQYDICVLDFALGDRIGPDLIRAARAAGCQTPVVMLTGRQDEASDREAMSAGADDYLVKGTIDAERLDRAIRYTLEQARIRAALEASEARLADMVSRLERSEADLRTLVDHLRLGVAMTADDGTLAYVNAPCARIFGHIGSVVGKRLDELGVLDVEALAAIEAMAARPSAEREKIAIGLTPRRGLEVRVEVDVVDDPRDARRRMYFFYDVTEVHTLRRQLDERPKYQGIVGGSPSMTSLFEQIREVAVFDATVLVEGETGTGKELVGRAIHAASHRSAGPYIPVNTAGLTESLLGSQLFGHRRGAFTGALDDHMGVFEAASGGTLFLDEIGDIPLSVQTMLLRVLQEREITRLGESRPRKVDVRVIAATHRDLAAEVEAGRFRMDLLYRIRVARLNIPPLRDRMDDVPLLVETFLSELRERTGKQVTHVSHDAMRLLLAHDWPGNVRELKAAIESGFIRCRGATIEPLNLPQELVQTSARPAGTNLLAGDEPTRIRAALEACGGRRTEAAKMLGMSRATFYRRLTEYGIDPDR